MSLIVLEAVGALALFVFLIWWTMFSGRQRGERREDADADVADVPDALPPSDHPCERGGSRKEPG